MKRDHKKLIEAAKSLARTRGLVNLSRIEVCRSARVPDGSFQHITGQTFVDFIEGLRAKGYGDQSVDITKSRVAPKMRHAAILDAAITVSRRAGWNAITRDAVATEADVSPAMINHFFGTVKLLRDAVMGEAVRRGDLKIIAQGLAVSHPVALRAPQTLRTAAGTYIAEGTL